MAEDHHLASQYKYHKHKIVFFFTSMRTYAEELKKKGYELTYLDCETDQFKKSFVVKLKNHLKHNPQIKLIKFYQISDYNFEIQIKKMIKELKIESIEFINPMFMSTRDQFKDYLKTSKKPLMNSFYIQQRKRHKILIDQKENPLFSQWSFDGENRKKYPKDIKIPKSKVIQSSPILEDVKKSVKKLYPSHPGDMSHYWIPYSRKQALESIDHFIDEKLQSFGPYQDAISSDVVFGFHSILSPMINNGLITPQDVVSRLLDKVKVSEKNISSVEGFIRQIIGWREFVKGIYDNYREKMETENFWQHQRGLNEKWYTGETGIKPFDDSVKRLNLYGYTHHIDRLMVQSNLMLLSEIHPHQVYRWFMEMYVDSADWVMAANVYGMGLMSEGGIFATKPYICGSNYLLKMSDYKKEPWCVIMDGLYWRFIDKHRSFFSKNPRLSMMVKTLEKMDPARKKEIFSQAENFIKNNTTKP